jgi:DNA topoisomerase-1
MEDLSVPTSPDEAAELAGLRYVSDLDPGIRRRRAGRGFRYVGPDGQTIRDQATLARIRSLAIPPAWTDVWICPRANGHLQASGRDARGRKQYRYHDRWRETRDATKFHRMVAFGETLPAIRQQVDADLELAGLPREKVLATVVRLLDETAMRIGNGEYARTNGSYGLTTLRQRHVAISTGSLRFQFRGKGGKAWRVTVRSRRLARIVKRMVDLPGQELFHYIDDQGERRMVGSADVNEYLRSISGQDFTAKDFRTWHGTVRAARALVDLGPSSADDEARHRVVEAIAVTADFLGNTPAICRKSYVHPAVIDAYLDGTLPSIFAHSKGEEQGLERDEAAVLRVLRGQARSGAD